ncbi:MFS transporter [Arenibacter sp. BSSL-BM3]|uniref:MFS transporter n=1 Tax=Arenibacter arenosicollis TaxID=2762274 RepID=A0ABR7QP08_9FLAO|nr:MFS transporter [Arenibacter arenosicollis]MBC8768923.1 MFS transporter [Arenibacter arenosicollis]
MKQNHFILPVIIISQFACTSLWFAGNAVIDDLILKTGLGTEIIGYVLSSVQIGFIIGTLVFALLMIADRYSPSKVFMTCAFLAAFCNAVLLAKDITNATLFLARLGTGFFLAGIYPVGMKIAADYYEQGLGKALGYLVGALVLGTAFPHLLQGLELSEEYTIVIKITSLLSIFGGASLFFLVPNGPYRKPSKVLQLRAGIALFRIPDFKKAAVGYFGHMWELYAFWAFIPFAIKTYNSIHNSQLPFSIWTFFIIALGGVSCAIGGHISLKLGSRKVATASLLLSGLLCITSPIFFNLPSSLFLIAFCLWGIFVASDSPQFSTLVANAVPLQLKGTALTLVNCIGFSISIISIQLLTYWLDVVDPSYIFTFLSIGPILGLLAMRKGGLNK